MQQCCITKSLWCRPINPRIYMLCCLEKVAARKKHHIKTQRINYPYFRRFYTHPQRVTNSAHNRPILSSSPYCFHPQTIQDIFPTVRSQEVLHGSIIRFVRRSVTATFNSYSSINDLKSTVFFYLSIQMKRATQIKSATI